MQFEENLCSVVKINITALRWNEDPNVTIWHTQKTKVRRLMGDWEVDNDR